ncbi:phosphotransferase enzyme family protein [Erysipelothrix urinaevulpis]|uniref:phosphotransferase enzyme family protein n=1 Tax=Erysipelothrix urinaevulpis TaxID=2683717 RepID=UPI00135ABB43|nr:aminoglycoside phosphotransferase family protein [Erysipelothrix urinaevulpis]
MLDNINEIVEAFNFEGEILEIKAYGNGHINDTFRLTCPSNKYILQRINDDVFTKPDQLMDNVEMVTSFLKEKIKEEGGDPNRETLSLIHCKNGKNLYKDSHGSFWRAYDFIDGTLSYDLVEDPEDFYQSGLGFGTFQSRLADFPIDKLNFTIEKFHHTPSRYEAFMTVLHDDPQGRAKLAQPEIEKIIKQKDFVHTLWDLNKAGKLDFKVTHNDTKLNNVLIDEASGKAICVVDLDTVMPGFALDDFGDSIRFGASTALEDEKDLEKVRLDLELFEVYVKGFLEGAKGSLSDLEIDLFPVGAKMMTLETGIRFLTDFLQGDTYFKTAYDDHNLVRARTQLKLVDEMERQWDAMNQIIEKYR